MLRLRNASAISYTSASSCLVTDESFGRAGELADQLRGDTPPPAVLVRVVVVDPGLVSRRRAWEPRSE
jgi:hypothetical protein